MSDSRGETFRPADSLLPQESELLRSNVDENSRYAPGSGKVRNHIRRPRKEIEPANGLSDSTTFRDFDIADPDQRAISNRC
jgi:hypothetical protein